MCFPIRQPLRNSIFYVLRVRDNGDFARLTQCFQSLDDGAQFHSIVRSVRCGAEHLFVMIAKT